MEQQLLKNNAEELGKADVKKLLIGYSVPAMVAMIASSLYNVIDRIFIGQGVGAMAIAGLAITFPLMNLAAAFGSLVGAGGSTLVSIKLGQRDNEGAERVLGNVVLLNLVIGIGFMAICLAFLDPILRLFGATDNTLPYAREFMQVILAGNIVTHLYLGLNNILRSSGYPRKAMNATLLTVLVNLVLAPIFIFVLNWGIRGAALATIMAQTVALVWVVRHFLNPQMLLHFKRGIFEFRSTIVKGILGIGASPFVMNSCACIVVIVVNRSLLNYGGDLAVGAYGIMSALGMLFAMILLGLAQGMQPIAGYNYGAQNFKRVKEVFKYTVIYATVTSVIAWLICMLFPTQIANLFTTDEHLVKMAAHGLVIYMLAFPTVGFGMVTGNFFQSIGKAGKSIFMSSTRQMLYLIPAVLLLPLWLGLDGVWYAAPISDTLAALTAAILLRGQMKEFSQKTKKQA